MAYDYPYIDVEGCETYCETCAPNGAQPDVNNSEWDYPIHCAECETLIDVPLTSDGVQYVIERLETPGSGRPEILQEWRDNYADALADAGFPADDSEE